MNVHLFKRRSRSFTRLSAAALLAAIAVGGASATAADAPATRPVAAKVEQLPLVSISIGRSTVIQSPVPIKRASVTDPKVADLQVVSPMQVLVSGKGVGATDLLLWGPNEEVHSVPISVGLDQTAIRAELMTLLPNAKIDVRLSNNVAVLTGMMSRAEEVDSLHRYLDASAIKYVDMTTVPGLRQVQIKVMIAEANRTAIRSLGINAGYFDGKSFAASNVDMNQFTLAPGVGGLANFADSPPLSSVTLFGRGFIGQTTLEGFVSALAENQYMRILAEPNLVAKSGQEASFLAGGEFPIPVVQSIGTGNNTSISIQYKEFGVRLHFRPTVLGDNRILLQVAPEVSQLSNGPGAVQIQGFSIPAILTRRAETTLEMNSGQTFAMAGLINQETQARTARVPGLGDLPVLGHLFRSVRYQQGDTELVLLVTASLVEPESMGLNPVVPGALHAPPSDWELYVMGRVEGQQPKKLSPADAKWMEEAGFGELRGPGAWATYQSAPAEARPENTGPAK